MMPPVGITRIVLVAISLLACAGFALGIRQVHDQQQAEPLVSGPGKLTAAKTARARRLLDGAAELNPDTEPDFLRAQLDFRTGERAAGRRLLLGVLRREPENINAWLLLEIGTLLWSPAKEATVPNLVPPEMLAVPLTCALPAAWLMTKLPAVWT